MELDRSDPSPWVTLKMGCNLRTYEIHAVIKGLRFFLFNTWYDGPQFVTGEGENQVKWKIRVSTIEKTREINEVQIKIENAVDKANYKFKVTLSLMNQNQKKDVKESYGSQLVEFNFPLAEIIEVLLNENLHIFLELKIAQPVHNYVGYPLKTSEIFFQNHLRLFESGELSDFTISVGSKDFQVHKAILAAQSPVLGAMLKNDMVEKKTNVLKIEDTSSQVMEEVLRFIYSGKCEVQGNAKEILRVADKYDLGCLKLKCQEHLESISSVYYN